MDISSKIRGFSTNVANYQPLGTACTATSTPFLYNFGPFLVHFSASHAPCAMLYFVPMLIGC